MSRRFSPFIPSQNCIYVYALRTVKKRNLLGSLACASALFVFATPAYASEKEGIEPPSADSGAFRGTNNKGHATYYFSDDDIEGEVLRPDHTRLGSRARSRHASLIAIRFDFISEMVRLSRDI